MSAQEKDIQAADRLWAEYARNRDPRTRDAIIHQFERLAYSLANRFARPGSENEDLFQVALMGLVKAVDRFDPSTNNRFSTFAAPTIMGELKRYFRDHSWRVHVPRGMQDLASRVNRAEKQMTERLGRNPTTTELAAHLDVPEEQVTAARALREINHLVSLDGEIFSDDSGRPAVLANSLGAPDRSLEAAEDRLGVEQAMDHLSFALRRVIRLRYEAELSQREVARRLGLSQTQVSRLEKRALDELRRAFTAA